MMGLGAEFQDPETTSVFLMEEPMPWKKDDKRAPSPPPSPKKET